MANLAVMGAQWGDEGKGKIVDLLCERFDVVARYQGGHNAGHTVKFADQHFALRLIRSGIRVADLLDPDVLREKITFACAEKNSVLRTVYGKPEFDPEQLYDAYTKYGEVLAERITNVTVMINDRIRAGHNVMFEGAQ